MSIKPQDVLFIHEPIDDFESFNHLATSKNTDLIFCTHHKSDSEYKNVIDIDMCLLERQSIYDEPTEQSLQFYDKVFSSFLYFFEIVLSEKNFKFCTR